jgi:hypothetical protein
MPDPFQLYPHFPAKLYSSQLDTKLESIKVDWVVTHFARWTPSPDLAVVLSLSRVSTITVKFTTFTDVSKGLISCWLVPCQLYLNFFSIL